MVASIPETRALSAFPGSSFKYGPLMHVRYLFIRFCQGLFHAAPENCYHWVEDQHTTEIFIADEETLNPEVIAKRPGISFTRGPVQFYSLGIDDMQEYDFSLDKKTKGVLIPGTMTINCCSRVPIESEHIAWVVAEHLWLLRHLMMRAGFFEIARGIQVGAPSAAGSIIAQDRGEEFTCTPVSVPFQFARTSSYTPLGKEIVNNIDMNLRVRRGLPIQSLGPAQAGHEYPMGVYTCQPESFAPNAADLQRDEDLPKIPHPLNPAKTVRVRVVRPHRAGTRLIQRQGATIPIVRPCVEQSNSQSAPVFTQQG